jgi:hypothetical protein
LKEQEELEAKLGNSRVVLEKFKDAVLASLANSSRKTRA